MPKKYEIKFDLTGLTSKKDKEEEGSDDENTTDNSTALDHYKVDVNEIEALPLEKN